MHLLEEITPANIASFKSVRLRGLQESPSAFGSTYAWESAFTEEEWLARAIRFSGPTGIGFLARTVQTPQQNSIENYCGIAGGLLEDSSTSADPASPHPPQVTLVAMWVAPEARRSGVASMLIRAVESWARVRGAKHLRLKVTSNNQPAIELYLRCGFRMTGHTEPYPNDPGLFEYEMSKSLVSPDPTADSPPPPNNLRG
jgi:ribosomal protein S18 acetylase RimI-like enzyme